MSKRPKTSAASRYRIQSVDRALVVLNTLATAPDITASQLAQTLECNRSLVFRLLTTLCERGFVAKDERSRYRLGPRVLYLGQQAQSGDVLIDTSRAALDRLFEQIDENVYLFVRDGLDILCIATRISRRSQLRVVIDVGSRGAIYRGPIGKMFLAYAGADFVDDVLSRHAAEVLAGKPGDRKRLQELLARIRRDGFYESIGDADREVYVLSAALLTGAGEFVAQLAIAVPLGRMSARRQFITARFREAAETLRGSLDGLRRT